MPLDLTQPLREDEEVYSIPKPSQELEEESEVVNEPVTIQCLPLPSYEIYGKTFAIIQARTLPSGCFDSGIMEPIT